MGSRWRGLRRLVSTPTSTPTSTPISPASYRSFSYNATKTPKGTHDASIKKARTYSPGVGFVAGLFGSMIGVGGGVLMNPMILSMCNTIPQRVLTGTSLGAVVSTALVSGSVFLSHESVDVGSAGLIAVSAMITAPIGAKMTSRLDCRQLRKILAYFLFGAAPLVPLKAVLASSSPPASPSVSSPREPSPSFSSVGDGADRHSETRQVHDKDDNRRQQDILASVTCLFEQSPLVAAQMLAIGGTAGLFSGLLGIGGGTIVTPLLALTTQLDHAVILGTSMTGMIAPSIAGLVQHYRMGNVDLRLLAGLVVGTSAGGLAGSKTVVRPDLPAGSLETLFCLGMLFLGSKTLKSIK